MQYETFDEGISYAMQQLADLLGVKEWRVQDGSETLSGDVSETAKEILVSAGLWDKNENKKVIAQEMKDDLAEAYTALRAMTKNCLTGINFVSAKAIHKSAIRKANES